MYVANLAATQFGCFEGLELKLEVPSAKSDAAPAFVLPNVNVLLGDNGAGKTTILRTIALACMSDAVLSSGYRPYFVLRRTPDATSPTGGVFVEASLTAEESGGEDRARARTFGFSVVRAGRDEVIQPGVTIGAQNSFRQWKTLYDKLLKDGGLTAADAQNNGKLVDRLRALDAASLRTFEDQVARVEQVPPSLYTDNHPAFFLCAYGVNRRVEVLSTFDTSLRDKSRSARYQRVASLFEEGMTLIPLGSWLPRMNDEPRGRIIELLNALVPNGPQVSSNFDDGEVMFEHRGVRLPFSQLSGGYRAYIAWIADLLAHAEKVSPGKAGDVEGVVLVDEIDLHLHPSWQRTVLPLLSKVLPKIQFIVSTHSPLVAGSVGSANIHVVDWPPGETQPRVWKPKEEIWGLSADQILTSSAFGLASTRNEEFLKKLHEVEKKPDGTREYTRMLSLGGAGMGEVPETPVPNWVEALEAEKKPAKRATPVAKKPTKKPVAKKRAPAKRGLR